VVVVVVVLKVVAVKMVGGRDEANGITDVVQKKQDGKQRLAGK
jgi:hypothetical protein